MASPEVLAARAELHRVLKAAVRSKTERERIWQATQVLVHASNRSTTSKLLDSAARLLRVGSQ